jgi:hypothetical protein
MTPDTPFTPSIARAAIEDARIAFQLTDAAFPKLDRYFGARARWANVHNLVGPRVDRPAWLDDLLDTVALATLLVPHHTVVDVGTGAGIPGLILTALTAESVMLVEPRTKRVAFLRSASRAMDVQPGIERARWPLPNLPEGPLQLVSRAVVAPDAWPRLAIGGGPAVRHIFRYLSGRPGTTAAPDGFRITATTDYLGGDGATRCLQRLEPM